MKEGLIYGKSYLYVMSIVVGGLIKIGKTSTNNFEQRMYILERNGYCNVVGLQRCFAIEVDDYDEKEVLLDNIFSKSQVPGTELFALDINLVIQLLSSFEGNVIYPKSESKAEIFDNSTEIIAAEKGTVPDGLYYLNRKVKALNENVSATIEVKNKKIILKSGSKIAPFSKFIVKGWLIAKNSLEIDDENLTKNDLECDSYSMASSIVVGQQSDGWSEWKTADGESIDIFRKQSVKNDD